MKTDELIQWWEDEKKKETPTPIRRIPREWKVIAVQKIGEVITFHVTGPFPELGQPLKIKEVLE